MGITSPCICVRRVLFGEHNRQYLRNNLLPNDEDIFVQIRSFNFFLSLTKELLVSQLLQYFHCLIPKVSCNETRSMHNIFYYLFIFFHRSLNFPAKKDDIFCGTESPR